MRRPVPTTDVRALVGGRLRWSVIGGSVPTNPTAAPGEGRT
jgi:hypothetical protein